MYVMNLVLILMSNHRKLISKCYNTFFLKYANACVCAHVCTDMSTHTYMSECVYANVLFSYFYYLEFIRLHNPTKLFYRNLQDKIFLNLTAIVNALLNIVFCPGHCLFFLLYL